MTAPVATDARIALLSHLFDHAPLFPPASLSMADALADDRRARASDASFALARFVCPASKLSELGGEQRALSVVVDAPLPVDRRIEAVEVRRPDDLVSAAVLAPEVYVELSVDDGVETGLTALAKHGLRAKVRCGGARVPTIDELARFVRACRDLGLVFKATAGLHRPFGGRIEHGFLNLLAAVVFGDEEEALAERDRSAFSLSADRFAWRGRESGAEELAGVRQGLLRSIGTCSFAEPVDELESLGVLPL